MAAVWISPLIICVRWARTHKDFSPVRSIRATEAIRKSDPEWMERDAGDWAKQFPYAYNRTKSG